MTDRLIVTGTPDGRVGVSYRRSGEDDAQVFGGPQPFISPLTPEDLADLTWYLERHLAAPYATWADKGTRIEDKLRAWGEALFEPVFGPGKVARALSAIMPMSRGDPLNAPVQTPQATSTYHPVAVSDLEWSP